ncbi:PDZ/DHR/GLGF domain protein [Trichuris suis]|nr:PDZ/DHR/GLGF domain protein [Trichuris suis]
MYASVMTKRSPSSRPLSLVWRMGQTWIIYSRSFVAISWSMRSHAVDRVTRFGCNTGAGRPRRPISSSFRAVLLFNAPLHDEIVCVVQVGARSSCGVIVLAIGPLLSVPVRGRLASLCHRVWKCALSLEAQCAEKKLAHFGCALRLVHVEGALRSFEAKTEAHKFAIYGFWLIQMVLVPTDATLIRTRMNHYDKYKREKRIDWQIVMAGCVGMEETEIDRLHWVDSNAKDFGPLSTAIACPPKLARQIDAVAGISVSVLLVLCSYLAGANWAIVSAQEERCAHSPTVSSSSCDDLAWNSGADVVAHFLADRCLQEAAMAEVNQSHRTYVSLTSRTVSTSAHFMQPFHTDAVDFTFKIGQSAAAMVNVLLADQSRPNALPMAAAKISTAIYSSGRSIVDWTHVTTTQSRGRPYDVASICQPWLSLSPIGRDRHSSSSSYTHGDQMQKMRGGSASGLGDATSPLATCQNKRWSVAGAAPELTLLRVKLDDVQRELCDLQSKHEVMTMEYQNVLNELECCRESKARLDTEVNEAKMEAMQWKNDYEMMIQQKQQPSERQVIDLQVKLQSRQTELEELRRQYRELLDGRPARRDLNSTLMDEYNDLCMEANRLKERCCILEGETMELRGALRLAQEEFRHLHLSHEEDMEAQRCKVSALEDRQVTLYQQLHKLAQDRDILRSENEMLKQQMQDLCSDVTRNLNIRQKLEEDMHLLRRQHDGVLAEYHHVMSERDSVLKENERLSEAKGSLMKKLKTSDSDRQALIEQLKTIEVQLESLRRERDELQHQVNVHEEELTEAAASTQAQFLSTDGDSGSHSTLYPETKSISSIEGELNGNGSTKLRVNDELRRLNDSLKEELTSVRQEVEGAKQQRDWALAERQRIVSEREGIRHMSETLRLERDEAVTNLAIAIRDADTLRCQKEHAERELRKLKYTLPFPCRLRIVKDMLEKGDRRLTNVESTPSNSHDSAIDTDMAEWEVENLEFNMSGCQKNEELGIVLRGGRDDPIFNQIVPIYVKSIVAGSKLDGVLRVYDCIMQVNNIDVSLMERRSVMDILRNSNAVKMVIRRRRLVGMKLISVPINTASDGGVGIVFEDGVYVSKIKTSSAAAKAGNLAVGDRLVYVNDIPVQNRSAENVDELIQSFKDCGLVLAVMKSPPVLSPITPTGGSSYNSCHAVVATSKDRHFDSFSLGHPSPKAVPKRDVSVQASLSADSTTAVPKKHESLLDKVHDKLFGRSERKATIRASAAIPMEPVAAAAATDSISVLRLLRKRIRCIVRVRSFVRCWRELIDCKHEKACLGSWTTTLLTRTNVGYHY